MFPAGHANSDPLIRKLESIAPLSDDERQAIVTLPMTIRDLNADQDIIRDQDRPSQCCLIIEGFACRYKVLPGGKRQIFSFHTPGDIPDLQSLHLQVMDHSLGTLVRSKVGFIPHETVQEFIRAPPGLAISSGATRSSMPPSSGSGWPTSDGARPTSGSRTSSASCSCG
jgi:CRP-like cAMP-binding protein